jgi:hypothetical protein
MKANRGAATPVKSKVSLAIVAALALTAGSAHADNLAVGGEAQGIVSTLGGAAAAPTATTGGNNPAVAGADGTVVLTQHQILFCCIESYSSGR